MLQIKDTMKLILAKNGRRSVMETLDITSPLISSWLSSEELRIVRFDFAVRIFRHYNIVVYPYSDIALRDFISDNDL